MSVRDNLEGERRTKVRPRERDGQGRILPREGGEMRDRGYVRAALDEYQIQVTTSRNLEISSR